jgi:hypothetical protein
MKEDKKYNFASKKAFSTHINVERRPRSSRKLLWNNIA